MHRKNVVELRASGYIGYDLGLTAAGRCYADLLRLTAEGGVMLPTINEICPELREAKVPGSGRNPDTWPARLIDTGPSAGSWAFEPPLTFGQVVRRERERRYLTLGGLAERIGDGDSAWIEGLEAGDGLNVTLRDVRRLSLAFGLTAQQLLADVGMWGEWGDDETWR